MDTPPILPQYINPWIDPYLTGIGVVAVGGNFHPEVLEKMYGLGIFPWPENDAIHYWFSPPKRMVLFTENWQPKKSLRQTIRKERFQVTYNQQFEAVMRACATVPRVGQQGTWIREDLITGFKLLHQKGIAESVEVWHNNALVGGLYGLRLGNVFFGESMFHNMTDASKVGFAFFVERFRNTGGILIDCQVASAHLGFLGAVEISKGRFEVLLKQHIPIEKSIK